MATIKNFNTENFNVKAVGAMNLKDSEWEWLVDLKVEVTDKETGIKVYDTVLKDRVAPMWDTEEDWYSFIEYKIDEGADIDEELEYCDADEDLQKEFDDTIKEQYMDWFSDGIEGGSNVYEFDDEDLAEIFDDDNRFVIIDGDKVLFTNSSKWDSIGYNNDTENEVYKFNKYIIEERGLNKYELRDKNDIKIVGNLFELDEDLLKNVAFVCG